MIRLWLMWETNNHKPPMTGNGKHTTYKNGDLGDGLQSLLVFYPHYIDYIMHCRFSQLWCSSHCHSCFPLQFSMFAFWTTPWLCWSMSPGYTCTIAHEIVDICIYILYGKIQYDKHVLMCINVVYTWKDMITCGITWYLRKHWNILFRRPRDP